MVVTGCLVYYVSGQWIGILITFGFAIAFAIIFQIMWMLLSKYCKCKICKFLCCMGDDKIRNEKVITDQEYKAIIQQFNVEYMQETGNNVLINNAIVINNNCESGYCHEL